MAKAPEIQKVTYNSLQCRSAPLLFHLCTKFNYVINTYQQCNANKVLHNWHCMSFVKVLSYSPCCSYMDRECGTLVDHSQYMVTVLDIGLSSAHPCCMQQAFYSWVYRQQHPHNLQHAGTANRKNKQLSDQNQSCALLYKFPC